MKKISKSQEKFNLIQSLLSQVAGDEAQAAVNVALRHGATFQEISDEMGISRNRVYQKYSKQKAAPRGAAERNHDDETIAVR